MARRERDGGGDVSESHDYNPYLAFSPCCGRTICLKCAEITERINEALEGKSDDNTYLRRQNARLRKHLAAFDHSLVEAA